MIANRITALILMSLALTVVSCSLTDSSAPSPIFLDIPSVGIATDADQGAATHKFTDVWVTADGVNLGVYPLPASVPIVVDGKETVDVSLFPGIRNNGVKSSAFIYSLMQPESYTIDVEVGATTTLTPTFRYKDEAKFDFVESFEGTDIFTFTGISHLGADIESTNSTAASGQRSGRILLNSVNTTAEIGTNVSYSGADNGGSDSYLEFDYKNDVPIFAGIYVTDNGVLRRVYDAVVTEQDDWNKIYIDFTLALASPTVTDYRVMFLTTVDGTGRSSGEVFIDNVKFVHF